MGERVDRHRGGVLVRRTKALPKITPKLPDANPKTAYGEAKPPLALIPLVALEAEAYALKLGADKYGAWNWRDDPVSTLTYLNAAMRHIKAFAEGENLDPESGKSHLGHARASLAIVLDAEAHGTLLDNRPRPKGKRAKR